MGKTSSGKSKERQSTDELEILREIIKADPSLLDKVLTKIKDHQQTKAKGFAEVVSEKKGAKREEERRKGSGT